MSEKGEIPVSQDIIRRVGYQKNDINLLFINFTKSKLSQPQLMSHSAEQLYKGKQFPIIEQDFFCEGQNVKVSLNQKSLNIKTYQLITIIKFTLDMEFQMIHEENIPVGFKIYTKLEKQNEGGLETENPESQQVQLFFYKYDWDRSTQWEKALISKIKKKGFTKSFHIIKKIGEGNFSEVYLVKELATGKTFAAKKIIKYRIENPKDKSALENEIKLLRMFDHENIAKLHGVYEEGKILYLVLEYVEGTSLQQYISHKKRQSRHYMSKDQIAKILRQILKAVRYMSKKGVLHRDLKPQNILITHKREIKIIDFNLATHIEEPKYLFVRCGTAGYVAPQILKIKDQQFESCRLATISDIFSVGTIFYKLIFGENLFTGSNSQIVKKNYKCLINFTDDMKKKMTPAEFQLLARMLQANPKSRITPTEALNHHYFEKFFVSKYTAKENINENYMVQGKNVSNIRQEKYKKRSFAETLSEFGKNLFSN